MNFRTDIKINLEIADMKTLQRYSDIKYICDADINIFGASYKKIRVSTI